MQPVKQMPTTQVEALAMIEDRNELIAEQGRALERKTQLIAQMGKEIRALIRCIQSRNDPHTPKIEARANAWKTPVHGGRYIHAIDAYRAIYGCTLKEAHDEVMAYVNGADNNG